MSTLWTLLTGYFYQVVRTWGGVILTIRKFLKLKTAFCEYWTSIKTKFSMICVSKEFEIKTKMVLEQWLQLERTFLFFCWVEFTFGFWRRGNKNLVGRRPEMKKLLACKGWRDSPLPPIPPVGKILYIYIYIYIYIIHINI